MKQPTEAARKTTTQLETEDSINGRAVRAICDISQVHLPEYHDDYYPFQTEDNDLF